MKRNEEHLNAVFEGKASLTEKGMRDFFSSDELIATIEALDQAIIEFNNWEGAAKIYFKKETEIFFTEVFSNDIAASQTVPNKGIYSVLGKGEFEGNKKIGKKRKAYINNFVSLLLQGWEPFQAEYELSEFAYQNNI